MKNSEEDDEFRRPPPSNENPVLYVSFKNYVHFRTIYRTEPFSGNFYISDNIPFLQSNLTNCLKVKPVSNCHHTTNKMPHWPFILISTCHIHEIFKKFDKTLCLCVLILLAKDVYLGKITKNNALTAYLMYIT